MEKLITDPEQKVLNIFGGLELTASHVYQQLSNRMATLGYTGASKYFLTESNDERIHYKKIEDFCNSLNSELSVDEVDGVTNTISNIKEALELALEMEKELLIAYEKEANNQSLSLKVRLLLQEFTSVQVKAVGEYYDLLSRLTLTTDMLLFDKDFEN